MWAIKSKTDTDLFAFVLVGKKKSSFKKSTGISQKFQYILYCAPSLSCVWVFVTLSPIARQAPPPIDFSKREY